MSEERGWTNIATGDIHTIPDEDLVDHDLTRDCWCQPSCRINCPEDCDDGCWACNDDGTVEVKKNQTGAVVVLHQAADGRE